MGLTLEWKCLTPFNGMVRAALSCHYPTWGRAIESVRFVHLHRFEGSQWLQTYITGVRKLVHHYDAYILYWCFPFILGVGYGEEFLDVGDGRSSLEQGVFKWLVSIAHLIWCMDAATFITWSHASPAVLLVSLAMINSMLGIPTLAWPSWGA